MRDFTMNLIIYTWENVVVLVLQQSFGSGITKVTQFFQGLEFCADSMISLFSGKRCPPLTIGNANIWNVDGLYGDVVNNGECDPGFVVPGTQTDRTFTSECTHLAEWNFTEDCVRESLFPFNMISL